MHMIDVGDNVVWGVNSGHAIFKRPVEAVVNGHELLALSSRCLHLAMATHRYYKYLWATSGE